MSRPSRTVSDRDLLARIGRSANGKAGYKQLIRELSLGGGAERRSLLEQLARLVAHDDLLLTKGDLWAVPSPKLSKSDRISNKSTHNGPVRAVPSGEATFFARRDQRYSSGRLELHRDGFGFVRPEVSKRDSSLSRPAEDIFIPPNALHGAMHGDMVLVDEDAPGRDGRRSGRIARVLTRRNTTVVGLFHYGRGASARRPGRSAPDVDSGRSTGNFVRPWDERLGGPIDIPPGAELLAPGVPSPHRTLGEEAHRPNRSSGRGSNPSETGKWQDANSSKAEESAWPLEGMAVEVEITGFPQPGRPATGRVIDVLGRPDAFGVDVEIVIRKHAIPHTFPAHVLAEADERAHLTPASLSEEELQRREDFRSFPVVTIDGETARDFDDAVLVRDLPNGNTELQVHIADVSSYVMAGSALDTEARVRGTSVYFPDRAVPMLPHALSSGMCSLLPAEDRLVLSCVMEIDDRGEVLGYRVAEGVIRSARRMTYTSVQRCLNASPDASAWNTHSAITPGPTAEDHAERERVALEQPELPAAFDRMLDLALRLNRKRVRRGSIDFDLPEPVVEFDPDGNMRAIVRSERGWAHRLIEEFMLSANECVATWLTAQGIPSMYRIHEMPDPKRIVDFEETAAAFGQTLGIGALPVKRLTMKSDRRESQRRTARGRDSRQAQSHELPERIPVTPQMYQRLVRKIQGKPEERILSYLMLRSLKQARYAEKNEGHFALASPCYTHFTSPIRRYPDLIVHRLLRAMLRRGAEPRGGAILSTDPQPWKTDLDRVQGGRAASLQPGSVLPAKGNGFPERETARAAGATQTRSEMPSGKKREGRIGWTEEPSAQTLAAHPLQDTLPEDLTSAPRHASSPEPVAAEELTNIAVESSQAERRAADAERELIEWKKMKFMADKIGHDFKGIILSVTKYGFFVELDEMFIEGLVPIGSLPGDSYMFRDADRVICGASNGHCFRIGDHVEVILDRIDHQQRRLQFALTPGTEPKAQPGARSLRKGKTDAKKARSEAKVKGKAKARKRRKH